MKIEFLISIFGLFFSSYCFTQTNDSISLKAFQFYENKEFEKARDLYISLQIKGSISDNDLFLLGKTRYNLKNYKEAIKINSNLCFKSDTCIKACYSLALSYCQTDTSKAYESAKPFFELLLKRIENDTLRNRRELYETYHYFGSYYYFNNLNKDSAIFYFDKMLSVSPNIDSFLLKAYSGLVLAYITNENYDKARQLAQEVMKIKPNSPILIYVEDKYREYLAKLYALPKNLDEAIAYFENRWSEKQKEAFKNQNEKVAVSKEHFGVGLWIRNNWCLGDRDTAFFNYFQKQGVLLPDYMSGIVLTSLHRKLNNKDIDLRSQVEQHQIRLSPKRKRK
jgi:tetratricopeptide (TPR) repeat protein